MWLWVWESLLLPTEQCLQCLWGRENIFVSFQLLLCYCFSSTPQFSQLPIVELQVLLIRFVAKHSNLSIKFDLSLLIENLTTGDPQEQVPLPTWDHYLKVRNDAELAKVGNRLQTYYPLSSWFDMIVSANYQCHHQRWKCGFQRFHAEIEWRSEKIYFMAFLDLKKSFVIQESNLVDRVGDWEEEWAKRMADAFEKQISENSKKYQ